MVQRPGIKTRYVDGVQYSDRDGNHVTEDIGYFDSSNQLHVLGSYQDLVLISGIIVAPSELEAVFLSHPDVRGCIVVGVDDNKRPGKLSAAIETYPHGQVSFSTLKDPKY